MAVPRDPEMHSTRSISKKISGKSVTHAEFSGIHRPEFDIIGKESGNPRSVRCFPLRPARASDEGEAPNYESVPEGAPTLY